MEDRDDDQLIAPAQAELIDTSGREGVRFGELTIADPEAVLTTAKQISARLKDIIVERKLFKRIGQKDHVYVDGWTTLASMLGCSPRTDDASESKTVEGEFVATVSIVRSDGTIVSTATALCGPDEKTWRSRTRQARCSMAQTRATGKACRLAFSWVMELAGYAVTPLEEMESEPAFTTHANPPRNTDAPAAQTRSQRQEFSEVSLPQFMHIFRCWIEDTLGIPYEDINAAERKKHGSSFMAWVKLTTGREFDVKTPAAWKRTEYVACCRSLNLEPLDE